MTDNLMIWDKVKSPDPKYTKSFNRAGGFKGTATNTQYQILAATKLFGPNGVGWGYEITDEKYVTGAPIADGASEIIHVVRGRVWYMHDGQKRYTSEQYGQTQFVGKNKYGPFTDEEAPKKSVSDMLLKCLALLGFSADIFLGLYDDNKYVNDVSARVEQNNGATPLSSTPKPELKPATPAWTNAIAAYKRDGNFDAVEARMAVSETNKSAIKAIVAKEDQETTASRAA